MKISRLITLGLGLLLPLKGIAAGKSSVSENGAQEKIAVNAPKLSPKEHELIRKLIDKASTESVMLDGSDCEFVEK